MKTFTYLLYILLLSAFLTEPATACLATVKPAAKTTATQLQNEPVFSLYPNPSKGSARIKLNHPIDGTSKIKFSNTIGKVVKVVDLSALTQGTEVVVDLTNLPAGVYFYSIMVNDKLLETKRMILEN